MYARLMLFLAGARVARSPQSVLQGQIDAFNWTTAAVTGSLQAELDAIEGVVIDVEASGLADTQQMTDIQTMVATWNQMAELRTHALQAINDVLKSIARNIAK